MLFETSKGAVPASAFFNPNSFLLVGGKGAGNFRLVDIITESFYRIEGNKKTSIIVDVDDKNCLAELTVVLKLNQGVRQWLYIIAGVLFFCSFFCTCKRKNIICIEQVYVLFALMQKEPKKSSPARSSAGRAGQRT